MPSEDTNDDNFLSVHCLLQTWYSNSFYDSHMKGAKSMHAMHVNKRQQYMKPSEKYCTFSYMVRFDWNSVASIHYIL